MSGPAPERLLDVIAHVEAAFERGESTAWLRVPDPNRAAGLYAGEPEVGGAAGIAPRSWLVWAELASRLRCRLQVGASAGEPSIELGFTKLDESKAWLCNAAIGKEKYAPDGAFGRIHKSEDPSFVLDLRDALGRVGLSRGARVLELGVNTAEVLELAITCCPQLRDASFVGVDHEPKALEVAAQRLVRFEASFIEADLAGLAELPLGQFDLVMSFSTLQSRGVDDRAVLRHIVQERLRPGGAVILGLPNCTYVDGEVLYGAKMKNFRQPDLSVVVKEIAFYRKYLHQHRFRVFVTGKHELLVTAVPAR